MKKTLNLTEQEGGGNVACMYKMLLICCFDCSI